MKKWAILNNYGDYEVWRLLETEDDIKPYAYIQYAIDKYGWDDVMPVCMNSVGGYHSLDKDKLVEIIEADTKPSWTNYEFLKNYVINNQYFNCGWISPNGDTYMCHYSGHLDMAEKLVDFYYDEQYRLYRKTSQVNAPDDFLLNIGWIKIDSSKNHYCLWDKVSDKAMEKLDSLEKEWKK